MTIDDERVYSVTPSTRIESADGARLRLEQIPVAPRAGGGFEAAGEAAAEYEAERSGTSRVLYWIVVGGGLRE